MKNWPKPELSYIERLNIKFTNKLYQFALKKERDKGLMGRINMQAKHNLRSINTISSNVSQFPSDLTLEEVVYYDIYPIEEFTNLRKGLSKIIRRYRYPKGSLGLLMHRFDRANDFLSDLQKFKFRGGSCGAGAVYFSESSNFECIDSVRLSVAIINPSYICLILIAEPSKYFKAKFHEISKLAEKIDEKIIFPNIKYGLSNLRNWHRFGHSSGNIIDFKHRELDELFLQANKEIVKCLRNNIKGGMSMWGPIPQIEIISTNEKLDNVVTDIYKRNDLTDSQKQFDAYLEYVGYSSRRLKPYSMEGANLYKIHRSKHYNLSAYQFLISLNKSESDSEDNIAYRNEILSDLNYLYSNLCVSLSIKDYLQFISDNLFELHKRISKVLEKETSKGISLLGFKKNISKTAKINLLKFQQNRFWHEITEQKTFSYLKNRMIEFRREAYNWEDDNDTSKIFLSDLEENTSNLKKSNDGIIEYLESANDQLLQLKNIVVGTRLQYAVVALTILLLVITLLLIPGFGEYVYKLFN